MLWNIINIIGGTFPVLLSQTRTGNLNVFFEKEHLLKDYDWGVVKNDLLAQPKEFPAMGTVGSFYRLIESLFALIDEIEQPSITSTIEIIENICKNVPKNEGEMCVFYDFEMPNPNSYESSKFKTLTIPWSIIDELHRKNK